MNDKLRASLAEERKAGFAAIAALQTQIANLRKSKKKLEAEMGAELNDLRSDYAALLDAARPVVWAWKIHGHEEYPSDALIGGLNTLSEVVGEGK